MDSGGKNKLRPRFWQAKWQEGHTPWDLGQVSAPVRTLVEGFAQPPATVLVPGCGRGHEALWLAQQGFQVTAVDLVAEPLALLAEDARAQGLTLDLREQDIFTLPADLNGTYDHVLEQTCLCAVDPLYQQDYAALAHRMLRPGGTLLAVLMEVPPHIEGPPYHLPPSLARSLFPAPHWDELHLAPVTPRNPERPGPEHVAVWRRR